jgi:hypothetical protein
VEAAWDLYPANLRIFVDFDLFVGFDLFVPFVLRS